MLSVIKALVLRHSFTINQLYDLSKSFHPPLSLSFLICKLGIKIMLTPGAVERIE